MTAGRSRSEVTESLFDKFDIGLAVSSYQKADAITGYTKVVIQISDDVEYAAGSNIGRTLTLSCPWGTQAMAEDLLASITGQEYQPYTAEDAVLDPAAEIGDALRVGEVYGGIYDVSSTFGADIRTNVSAPGEEEVDESAPFKSATDRKIERQYAEMKSTFTIQQDQIAAKVSKSGGDSSSFGWELDEKSWVLKSNGSTVLSANKDGVEVKGIIRATGGEIGGFTINSNSITFNGQTWGGDVSRGAYFGSSGLQLGKNFKVDMQGRVTASDGEFTGTVHAGKISYGDNSGYFSGSGLSGSSVTNAKMSSGVNTSLGYADYANGVFNGYNTAREIACEQLSAEEVLLGGLKLNTQIINYTDGSGATQVLNVVTWDRGGSGG